ncbi:MAG: hypothetical protein U5O39_09400 [Gammaproteobacteria bacterium]|nr:hypothetical protein [Gammaproteobacteria bacterium]
MAPPVDVMATMGELMLRDKKATDEGLVFIVLTGLGRATIDREVPPEVLARTLEAGTRLLDG